MSQWLQGRGWILHQMQATSYIQAASMRLKRRILRGLNSSSEGDVQWKELAQLYPWFTCALSEVGTQGSVRSWNARHYTVLKVRAQASLCQQRQGA